MNSTMDNAYVNVHECEKCLKLETELLNKKDFIKKETYDKLFRSFTTLEKHCISLEVDTQLNQEIFQRDNSVSNQSAPNFDQYFELNELKAQSQEKDTVIKKLKERIKSLNGNMNEDKVKKDIEETETINIELDHREKDLVITALKDELRKLKGKDLADNVVTKHTIAPEMIKIDVEPIAPRLLNNMTAHSDYLRHTQEQAAILREIVERGKSQNPLNNSLESAFAFRQHTCFIRNLEGVDLLTGSRGNNLYTLSLGDMMASSPICLLLKASKTKSWLWHRRLSHLNFGAINHLARHGLVRGLPKLKFEKDHLCSACAMGKSKKKPHKPKSEDTNQEKLYLLHMDLCGPMRVASVNGKKYILVIVDDYSRFTWVKCLRSKDEALDFIIKFLKMIQVRLKVPVRRIITDNGTEFVNQTLREYCEKIGISHETSVARTSQTDWDILFQPLFDELLNPSSSVDRPPEVIAPIAEVVALEPAASRFHRKLTNLNLDERYQKKINLSRPDSYHSDLRKMNPYTAYPDIQGIIYQDDMDKNRLMCTDELHKFSDGTLNHVRTALNDIATKIQM
ncbi:retrovirus-related pol polyprotein from transposon TNT 1-94 [Tanacetum coccineum]|uniref:Retrovirus-related pol polyprotein from transposon TNT 1-94 n=1 Tax=Tanacetum coccineum TaxID=301880 RepID=A0ABQ5J1E9_9ASTR